MKEFLEDSTAFSIGLISLVLSIPLLFAGCSSENEDLKKKIPDLERENELNLDTYWCEPLVDEDGSSIPNGWSIIYADDATEDNPEIKSMKALSMKVALLVLKELDTAELKMGKNIHTEPDFAQVITNVFKETDDAFGGKIGDKGKNNKGRIIRGPEFEEWVYYDDNTLTVRFKYGTVMMEDCRKI